MTILELPGSGTRLSALLSGRIDAGSLHFDQVESIMDKGNFQILIEPWKEFAGWTNEVWVVRTEWLAQARERARADRFPEGQPHRVPPRERRLRLVSRKLSQVRHAQGRGQDDRGHVAADLGEAAQPRVRAWPTDGNFSVAAIQAMLPACKAADAIRGTVKVEDVVETRYLQQALKELG